MRKYITIFLLCFIAFPAAGASGHTPEHMCEDLAREVVGLMFAEDVKLKTAMAVDNAHVNEDGDCTARVLLNNGRILLVGLHAEGDNIVIEVRDENQ